MTTSIDTKAAAGIKRALDTAGTDITFQEQTNTYVPGTSGVTEGATTDHTVKGVPPSSYRSVLVRDEHGRAITFFGTYVAGTVAFTPVIGMKVTHKGDAFDIVRVGPIYSGDDVALWEIEVSK